MTHNTRVDEFVRAHQEDWQRLEELLRRLQRGRKALLTGPEVVTFGALYRQAAADLALAQRDYAHAAVAGYLNDLVGRAHPYVYRREMLDLDRVARFYRRELPRAFRAAGPFVLASGLVTVVSAVLAFAVTLVHPDAAGVLLPAEARGVIPIIQHHELWMNVPSGTNSATASFIMTNNMRVALFAFAGGVTAGLYTLYILLQNGIMLGTVAGLCQDYGLSLGLWSFIFPHGVIELSTIVIAGGAGFMLGWAVLRPGLRRRQDALADAAGHGVRLLAGVLPLLVVAGTLEGFLSPSPAPALLKFATGIATGLLLFAYLLGGGRLGRRRAGLLLAPAP